MLAEIEKAVLPVAAVVRSAVKTHPYVAYAASIVLGGYLLKKIVVGRKKPLRTSVPQDADIIIVGCGIGGAALATVLARDGRKVIVIERSMEEPDRIVGELMQPGGVRALQVLNLQDSLTGIDAVSVQGYVVHSGKDHVALPYPQDPKFQGQPRGSSFVHGKFVQGLRRLTLAEKNVTVIEGMVEDVIVEGGAIRGVTYVSKGKKLCVRAPLTFLIDGINSKFRGRMTDTSMKSRSYFCGCIVEGCETIKEDFAEVILTPSAPVLVYPIGHGFHRILCDIPAPLPNISDGSLKQYFMDTILPFVPKHVQGPLMNRLNVADDKSHCRLRSMPCNFLPAAPICQPGGILIGDAFNMRHPLTGGGMSVVLNDIIILRAMLKDIHDLADHERLVQLAVDFHWQRKRNHSFAINVLAMALSELFAGYSDNLSHLRTACFQYFQSGPSCTDGPTKLLGAINPNPYVLVYHFFAVALRAVSNIFRSNPWYMVPYSAGKSVSVLYTASAVILPLIRSEFYRPKMLSCI